MWPGNPPKLPLEPVGLQTPIKESKPVPRTQTHWEAIESESTWLTGFIEHKTQSDRAPTTPPKTPVRIKGVTGQTLASLHGINLVG